MKRGTSVAQWLFTSAVLVSASVTGAHAENRASSFTGPVEQDVAVLDRPRPEYDAKGVPLDSFRLYPSLDVTGTYDDNIFRLANASDDFYFTTSPTLRLASVWGRHFFEVYGGLNEYDYLNYTGENLVDWKVGTAGRIDISRAASIKLDAFHGYMHELWSSPNNLAGFQAAPNRFYQSGADVAINYTPNRFGVLLFGQFDRYNYQTTPAVGGGVLFNDDRDQYQYKGSLKLSYDFSPGYSAFAQVEIDNRQFDSLLDRSGLNRSSTGYHYDGGLDVKLSQLLTAEVFAGYMSQKFGTRGVTTPLPSVTGLDYGAKLDWYVDPTLTVHLSGERSLEDVVIAGASVSDNKSVALSADYEFLRNVLLQAHVGFTEARFVGTTRTDSYPSTGIGIEYLMNRHTALKLGYDFEKRSSSVATRKYNDNRLTINLQLHI